MTHETHNDDNQEANARLIAAAPDLLLALDNLRIFAESIRDEWQTANPGKEYNSLRIKLICEAQQAIAKAEGRG